MVKRIVLIMLFIIPFLGSEALSSDINWVAKITASSGEDSNALYIGGYRGSVNGLDNGDAIASLDGSLKAYFYHPEWERQDAVHFWADVREFKLPQEWTFYVQSLYSTITISWDLKESPDTVALYLVDAYNGATIDMRGAASYTYTNTSTTAARTFTVSASGSLGTDTTPPETSITTTIPAFIGSSDIAVSYTGSDNASLTDALQFSYSVDGATWSDWSTSTSVDLSGLSDGAHTFSVKSKDEAGNEDSTPAVASFTVDTTAPTLTVNNPNPASLWPPTGRMITVTFSGNAKDTGSGLNTVSYVLTDEYNKISSSGNVSPSTDGAFSFNLSLKAERNARDRDGRVYTVTITATDNVGNSVQKTTTVIVPHSQTRRGIILR